ncbi:hypothetical protein RB594_001526 [Gaeumannomyces avenae]
MAKKAKSRIISVRLLSMAMTGFFYTMARPRTSTPMSMLKYDPIGERSCSSSKNAKANKSWMPMQHHLRAGELPMLLVVPIYGTLVASRT